MSDEMEKMSRVRSWTILALCFAIILATLPIGLIFSAVEFVRDLRVRWSGGR